MISFYNNISLIKMKQEDTAKWNSLTSLTVYSVAIGPLVQWPFNHLAHSPDSEVGCNHCQEVNLLNDAFRTDILFNPSPVFSVFSHLHSLDSATQMLK